MGKNIDRREFLKQGTLLGVSAAAGFGSLTRLALGDPKPAAIDVSVAGGTNFFDTTVKAVGQLGGMEKFVWKGSRVGLLINSPWNKPGTYTNPDVSLAVLTMALDAGAKEVISLEGAPGGYWRRSRLYGTYEKKIGAIVSNGDERKVSIPTGKSLKEATVSTALLDCDVFINVPIVKNHEGTRFTGNLKNFMGACSGSTNRYFHSGSGKGSQSGYYNDVEFLSQCIADVNLIRTPDLCVVDATEFVRTNGPAGPGELVRAHKVVAGRNCVSVDAYCATLLGLNPADVAMISFAAAHGIGEMDLKKLTVKEI